MSKTSYVVAIPLVVWLAVAWRWDGPVTNNIGLLIAGFMSTLLAFWYVKATQSFAERNPALALLEGAELLEWQRMETAAKGLPSMVDRPMIEIGKAAGTDV